MIYKINLVTKINKEYKPTCENTTNN